MKCAGLDIGNVWTGVAISDALKMFARPYTTLKTEALIAGLSDIFSKEQIDVVVVGHPITMRGATSKQTESVEKTFAQLKQLFPHLTWTLWDERLSSKRAQDLKKADTKDKKITSHAVAAAFILASYLDNRAFQNETLY